MRPDSIDIPPELTKPEPIARVKRARPKEREERQKEFEEHLLKKRGRDREDAEEKSADHDRQEDDPATPRGGKSHVEGKRLDLLV